ncbi:MAG: hypothetical protein F8N38_01185 [Hungatella sp.]|nr:hypothetical protein [Hungatella sp.]
MSTKEKADVGVGVSSNKDNKAEERKCFIITPIGNSDSEIFRHINGVIQSVIRPVLKDCGFTDIRAAHEISDPGSINNQLVNRIIDDDLVIANLTGKNPNVMYELCLRHAVAKPVIHICEEGTNLPFDIKGERTIFYKNDMYGSEELKIELIKSLNSINYEKEYKDNPIYSAIHLGKILKTGDNEKIDANTLILREIQRLSQELASINNDRSQRSFSSRRTKSSNNTFVISIDSESEDSINLFKSALLNMSRSYGGAIIQMSIDMTKIYMEFNNPVDSNIITDAIIKEALNIGIDVEV